MNNINYIERYMDTEIEKLSKKIDESFNSNIELLDQSLDSLAYQMIQTEELLSIDYEKISTEIRIQAD